MLVSNPLDGPTQQQFDELASKIKQSVKNQTYNGITALDDLKKALLSKSQYGDLYADTPLPDQSHREMLVNIVFVFGPAHGKTMTLPGHCVRPGQPVVWMEEREAFVNMDAFGGAGGRSALGNMPPIHQYFRHDDIDNDTEYCTIYVHDSRCCDKVMP